MNIRNDAFFKLVLTARGNMQHKMNNIPGNMSKFLANLQSTFKEEDGDFGNDLEAEPENVL